jgi:hypothetical protein
MSIKCPTCGLVNFADAEACRRCKQALRPSPAAPAGPATPAGSAAPAGPTILGRVSTKHGFKDLFVIALEDCIVLAPHSMLGSIAQNALPMPILAGLVGLLVARKGETMAGERKAELSEAPADQLRSDPNNIVIPLADLRSIVFTRNLVSAWVEFVRSGGPTKFEVNYTVYTELCDATERRFPGLYRSDERTATLLDKRRAIAQKNQER